MLIFGQTKVTKEKFYVGRKSMKIWDADVENIAISKFIETKN